jgi:Raf kinase inhibitor-like YbhB/YbcL family protein
MAFALSDLEVTTPAFRDGESIPAKHTCEGDDVSPALSWKGLPEGTKSVAVFCHDPDAPLVKPGAYGFTHWLIYNLPGGSSGLEEGTSEGDVGVNDAGNSGYNGPAPPPGDGLHRYFFWVLALDQELNLEAGLTLEQFLEKVEPHLLGMNRIMGSYRRD